MKKKACLYLVTAALILLLPAYSGRPGLQVLSDLSLYRAQAAANPDLELVDLEAVIPGIVLDIRYAGPDNFTGEIIYTSPKAFARRPVAAALQRVQTELAELNLGLKIYDAYRPYAATVRFYEVYPDPDFVADPRYGSRHNRGCAVDVTLVNLDSGLEIPMPTDYDEFTERAHPEYADLPEEVIRNRQLLFDIMARHGFSHYPTEWWHFDFHGWEDYPLMDLSFEQLLGVSPDSPPDF